MKTSELMKYLLGLMLVVGFGGMAEAAYGGTYYTTDLDNMFVDLIGTFVAAFIEQAPTLTDLIVLMVIMGLIGGVLATVIGLGVWSLAKMIGLGKVGSFKKA